MANDYDPGNELVAGRGIGRFVAIIGLMVTLAGFLGVAAVIYDAFQNGSPGSSPLDLEIVPGIPLLSVGFLAFLFGGIAGLPAEHQGTLRGSAIALIGFTLVVVLLRRRVLPAVQAPARGASTGSPSSRCWRSSP